MDNTQPQTGARLWHVFKAGFLLYSEILWSLGDTDAGADHSRGLSPTSLAQTSLQLISILLPQLLKCWDTN